MSSNNQKIDHIGIEHQLIEEIESQQVRVATLAIGEINIELLESTSPESPIAKFLVKNGEGMHHIAFATDSIENKLDQARKSGVRFLH